MTSISRLSKRYPVLQFATHAMKDASVSLAGNSSPTAVSIGMRHQYGTRRPCAPNASVQHSLELNMFRFKKYKKGS